MPVKRRSPRKNTKKITKKVAKKQVGGHKVKTVGSRAEVMHGNAMKTSGGLVKKNLKYNKNGRIVSRKKSSQAKKQDHLGKAGYATVPGKFGAVKIDEIATYK